MFGLAPFGGVPFGGIPPGYFVAISEAAAALDAESSLAELIAATVEAGAAFDLQSSQLNPGTSVSEAAAAVDAPSSLAVYPSIVPEVLAAAEAQAGPVIYVITFMTIKGRANVEFVGTTKFIDMIEQSKNELGIAAEIRVRSL